MTGRAKRAGTRWSRAIVVLASIALALPMSISAAAGDVVTPWNYKVWADGASAPYAFDSSVPTWLRTVMRDVMNNKFDDPNYNNSNGPHYYEGTSALITVYEVTGANAPAFCASNFLGCATSNAPKRIWIREDPWNAYGTHDWCHVDLDDNCIDVGFVAIHEVGHMGGYLEHYPTNAFARSRMTVVPPKKGQSSSYAARTLGRCDAATMQMKYDVFYYFGKYPDCWDEVANTNSDGSLKTDLSAETTATIVCSGETIYVSGRLNIHDYAAYERVGGNNLPAGGAGYPARVVKLYRSTTLVASTSTLNVSQGSDNWSVGISQTVAGTTTYTYHAEYDSAEVALGSATSASFQVTWVKPALC